MLIYNVTVNIDDDVHSEWLSWMKEEHIPKVMACGLFSDNRILKVLADDEGHTYSIQYRCASMDTLETYFNEHAPALQDEHTARYKDKFVAFRTILEEVT
ncbi:MAG: DUF4286 family protein [Flavobacteriales bacterium]|nr:DUF4286 family protein [Flavobacteriales bacterium]